MIDYEKILIQNYSQKAWSFSGNSYDTLIWLDDSPKPTKQELDSQWLTVKNYLESKAYIDKRQVEYPKITDQLDMLWHAIDSGSLDKDSDFYKSLKAVKDANPKG